MTGLNRTAIDKTVEALRTLGRIDPVDEAIVVTAEGLADAVDNDSLNASLWREYRAAVQDLMEVGRDENDDNSWFDIIDALHPQMGDFED